MTSRVVSFLVVLAGTVIAVLPFPWAPFVGAPIAIGSALYGIFWSGPGSVAFKASDWIETDPGQFELRLGFRNHGVINPGHVDTWEIDEHGTEGQVEFGVMFEGSTAVLTSSAGSWTGHARIS